ncbi:hypothetical protein LCGC14_1915240 [marine sediment metagenome]|uniref:Uncharacterized protein n=1 Tax=marine sediment metagenome TaxID=412755 RepID=A0A0F9GFP6_9ZZZZ
MTLYQCPICKTVVWMDRPRESTPVRYPKNYLPTVEDLEAEDLLGRERDRVPRCHDDCCDMDLVETES